MVINNAFYLADIFILNFNYYILEILSILYRLITILIIEAK